MDQKIIKIARERYGADIFRYHIRPVVRNALLLSKRLGADADVVETAAYLHDIGDMSAPMRENVAENDHNVTGAKSAEKILGELQFSPVFIQKVSHCILTHRGRKGPPPETLEAKIVACADAMAHFDAFLDLFRFFLRETGSFEETVSVLEQKIGRDWEKKLALPEAKEIVKQKHEAILLLLKSAKECMRDDVRV